MEKQYPNDWVDKINPILVDLEISTFSKTVRAGYELGFDGVGVQYIPFILESQTEMTDIFGKRHKVRNIDGNPYPDYYGGYIKNRDDWEKYPKPDMKEEYKTAKKFYKGVLRKCRDIKDDICIIAQNALTSVFPPVWQGMGMNNFVRATSVFPPVWQGMGMNNFARALKNDPKLIEERFRFCTDFVLAVFRAYSDCGAKIFLEGGDTVLTSF
jgi:hypothetical protein